MTAPPLRKITPSGPLGGAGGIYVAASMSQLLATAVLLPVLTHLLSAAEIGEIATGQLVTQMAALLIGVGLPTAIGREYFEQDGPKWSSALLGWAALAAFGLAALLHLGAPWWSQVFVNLEYGTILMLAVAAAAPRAVVLSGMAYYRSDGSPRRFGTISFTSAVGGQLLGLVLVILWPSGAASAVLSGVLVANCVAALFVVHHCKPRPIRIPGEVVRRSLLMALPVVPHALAGLLLVGGDRVIIERTLGLDSVARYQVAYVLGGLGVTIMSALNHAWLRQTLGSADKRRWLDLARSMRVAAESAAILASLIALAGPPVVLLATPYTYEPGELELLVSLVAASVIPFAVYTSSNHVLFHHRQMAQLSASTIVVATFNVVANLVLVPRWGLSGAAVATFGAYLLLASFTRIIANRIAQVPWLAWSTLRASIAAAPILGLAVLLPNSGLGLAIRVLVLPVVAVGGAIHLRRRLRDLAEKTHVEDDLRLAASAPSI